MFWQPYNAGTLQDGAEELPEGLRRLMQSATPDNTHVANDLTELGQAILGAVPGAEHIELRFHAVLTNLTGPDPQGRNGAYMGGPFRGNIKSIRVRIPNAAAGAHPAACHTRS